MPEKNTGVVKMTMAIQREYLEKKTLMNVSD